MATIKEIVLKNFKSFKSVRIPLSSGFICIVGPNGSGKSNLTDSIRFIFGDSGLHSLRARKVSDLIYGGGEKGLIKLILEDLKHNKAELRKDGIGKKPRKKDNNENNCSDEDNTIELCRAIRSDGKTIYRLNDKVTTKKVVLDFLKSEGIELGSHNIIAQGEVEKIIKMKSRERREIIDNIAGVAEFEEKKIESLNELGKVERKLNDASIVLKEREGVLFELEKESDNAIKHNTLKEEQRRVKGSIIISQYKKFDNEFTGITKNVIESKSEQEKLMKELGKLEGKIGEIDEKRQEINSKISSKDTMNIYSEVESIKSNIAVDENVKKEKSNNLGRLKSELEKFEKEWEDINNKLSSLSGAKKNFVKRAAELKKRVSVVEKEKADSIEEWGKRRKKLKIFDDKLDELRKKISILQQEVAKLETKIEMNEPGSTDEKSELEKRINSISIEIGKLNKNIEEMFNKEKELNKNVQSIDSLILKKKEDLIIFRAMKKEAVPRSVNYLLELRNKGKEGIYGTVSELFNISDEYKLAAETAAGARLNYIIVENMDVAINLIKLLKSNNAGRATFIPLNVRSSSEVLDIEEEGVVGSLIRLAKFEDKFKNVMGYVFGNTLLVEGVDIFKKVKKMKTVRMVTLQGDIAETSGVVTGGSSLKRSFVGKNNFEELEKELEEVKKRRQNMIKELYSIHDSMSELRKNIASLEIKRKGFQIELDSILKQSGDVGDIKKEVIDKGADLQELEREVLDTQGEKERIRRDLENLEDEKEKERYDKEIVNIKTELSALEEKLKGGEAIILQERNNDIGKNIADLSRDTKIIENEIKEIEKNIKQNERNLKQKEDKIRDESKSLEGLYNEVRRLQEEYDQINFEKGKFERKIERLKENLVRWEAEKESLETRLADLKAEADMYKDVKPIQTKKEDLEKRNIEIENEIQSLGFVNLKAPEMYKEKSKNYNEIKFKVGLLRNEKQAIIKMIEEIETKKKNVFMKTYESVNEHFKNLVSKIFDQKTYFSLEKPENPFDGGLDIIIEYGKKKRNIEAMSGGEKSLLIILFIFALHMYRPSQFYILDEVEAALDKENSKKFASLIKDISKNTQMIVVSHNDAVIPYADVALGVTRTDYGSKIVGIKLSEAKTN